MARKEKESRTPFGRLLRQLRKQARMGQEEFAAELGISTAQLGRYERGAQLPPEDTLESIIESAGLQGEKDNLFAAAGYPVPDRRIIERDTISVRESAEVSEIRPVRPSDGRLPVLGYVNADAVVHPDEHIEGYFPVLQEHAESADGVVEVRGYSMLPNLQPGDYAGVRTTNQAQVGQVVLAKREDVLYLKRLAKKRGRWMRLESDNPAYEPIEGEDLTIVGVVVWSHRKHI